METDRPARTKDAIRFAQVRRDDIPPREMLEYVAGEHGVAGGVRRRDWRLSDDLEVQLGSADLRSMARSLWCFKTSTASTEPRSRASAWSFDPSRNRFPGNIPGGVHSAASGGRCPRNRRHPLQGSPRQCKGPGHPTACLPWLAADHNGSCLPQYFHSALVLTGYDPTCEEVNRCFPRPPSGGAEPQ